MAQRLISKAQHPRNAVSAHRPTRRTRVFFFLEVLDAEPIDFMRPFCLDPPPKLIAVLVAARSINYIVSMHSDNETERRLLAALRAGHPDAFRQTVESLKHTVLNICFRFVRNREDAEELAQETFVEVHRSVSRFRGDASLSTWVHRIAVTKSLSHLRHQRRLRRGGPQSQSLHLSLDAVSAPAGSDTDPHDTLERAERQAILEEAIDSLPGNQRTALILSRYDGLSHQAIADILDTTVPAVEALLHRAQTKLRKKLYKYYRDLLP